MSAQRTPKLTALQKIDAKLNPEADEEAYRAARREELAWKNLPLERREQIIQAEIEAMRRRGKAPNDLPGFKVRKVKR